MSNANYPKQSEQPPPPVHPMEANQIISANGVTRSKMGTGTVQVPMQVPPQTPIINVTAAPERDPNMCHCCGCTCPYWACIIVFVVVSNAEKETRNSLQIPTKFVPIQ